MANNFRILFNPVTKEIEIEGTEKFVKTYFGKIQAMVFGPAEKTDPARRARKTSKKQPRRVTNIDTVIGLIKASTEGISTAEIKEKTGLAESQIWNIVNRAKKDGKIRKAKRGLYSAV